MPIQKKEGHYFKTHLDMQLKLCACFSMYRLICFQTSEGSHLMLNKNVRKAYMDVEQECM